MITRYYSFRIYVRLPRALHTEHGRGVTVSGIISHKSWFPRPNMPYLSALEHALAAVAAHHGVKIDPRDAEFRAFYRIT